MTDRHQTIRELLAPALALIEETQYPLLFALAEREAAQRYRVWAEGLEDVELRDGLMRCAEREDEIAELVEGLYPRAEHAQEEILARIPGFVALNRKAFDGLSVVEQYALQVAGERAGADSWRAFAAQTSDPKTREVFLRCARLEEESAEFLEERGF